MQNSNLSINPSEEVINIEEAKRPSKTITTPQKVNGGATQNQEKVELVVDNFGVYYDEDGDTHNIERFTWKNKNKIQVQVINYGARVTSLKMPDRKGNTDDIVLGFDDIAGYVYNKDNYFGASIGRMTNVVKNSTFQINNKQYWLTSNQNKHHYNGGHRGLDQVVWTTYIEDRRVIMSHVSPNMSEGYPGDLLIRIMFELSVRNEFNIKMEAQCTQPTIVNLSNLTYFNLGGHQTGSNEIYKHVVTINCNCFTPLVDGIPSGEILNVIHSGFDFQIPKVLGKIMGIVPKDGFNQNLCISRGMDQGDCFVARALHPPSGRLMEIYSNQRGVNFTTANEFGYGNVMSTEQLLIKAPPPTATYRRCEGTEPLLRLYEKVHKEVQSTLLKEEETTFKEIYDLIKKIKELCIADTPNNTPVLSNDLLTQKQLKNQTPSIHNGLELTQLQLEYLNNILKILCDKCDEDECEELKDIINVIISSLNDKEEKDERKNAEEQLAAKISERLSQMKQPNQSSSRKRSVKMNFIPDFYLSTNKILGKERAHYKTHGGIAFQTQNYPACANFKNFPNCILKPGETYTHTITYKFWIRAGNPSKWIRRNMMDNKKVLK